MTDFSRMDVVRYLDDQHIEYRTEGQKNVGQGWIGTNCPFCKLTRFGDDYGGHLGINLTTKAITCWRCGTKGPITKYIKEVEDISYFRAESIAQQYFGLEIKEGYTPREFRPENIGNVLRSDFLETLLPVTRKYLERRKFDPDYLVKKYDIMDGGNFGPYAWRVIIPFIQRGRVVSYTSRTIQPSNLQPVRYKMCPEEEAAVPRNQLLYNIDTVSKSVIICEGPTDVWRIGDSSIATAGTQFSSGQIEILKNRGLTRAFILYDPEAETQAERLASSLKLFCNHVEVVYLEDGKDPGDLTDEEAKYLKRDLLGF